MKIKFKDLKPGDEFEVPYNNYWFVKINEKHVFTSSLSKDAVEMSFNAPVLNEIVLKNEGVLKKEFLYYNHEMPPAIYEINIDPDFGVSPHDHAYSFYLMEYISTFVPKDIIDLI